MNNIKSHFKDKVADYDTVVDKVVFRNDELHKNLVDAINFDSNASLMVLDLGFGTGHGAEMILEKFPNARLVGIDFSEKMLKKATQRLGRFGDRVDLKLGDFIEIDFGGGFDVVVSAVAIHNCTHEDKKKLFERICIALKSGGTFVNGDFFEHADADENFRRREEYKRFLEVNLSGRELEVWLHHAFVEDMPMMFEQQFEILQRVGFSKPEVIWEYINEAVYKAEKS